jgi:NTE family protein
VTPPSGICHRDHRAHAIGLLTGTEVRLSDGPLADAVLAAAIPGVPPPVRWRGRLLADGGIADNTPVSHAVALGARRIYVLPTQNPGDRGLPRAPRAALAGAVHAVTVLTNARLRGDASVRRAVDRSAELAP